MLFYLKKKIFLKEPSLLSLLLTTIIAPIDGQYTQWSKFSSCSKTCGEGHQTRTRTCTKSPPSKCGKDCIGADKETRSCTENPGKMTLIKLTYNNYYSWFYNYYLFQNHANSDGKSQIFEVFVLRN